MGRTRIKICGLRDPDHARLAGQIGVDAIGLVFAEGSPRQVDIVQARAVIDALPAFVEPVGLFVDAPVDVMRTVATELGLRTLQLHGSESPEVVAALAPLSVVKALAVRGGTLAEILTPWRKRPGNLAALLFDTPPPADATLPGEVGGTGRAFDWRVLGEAVEAGLLDNLPPVILAGGLTAENVAEAIARVRPYAVDVSSGVESSRGVKDAARMRAFCEAVTRPTG